MNDNLEFVYEKFNNLKDEMNKIIIGQDKFIEKLLVCFFSGGNILIEGVPGLAKTLSAKAMAKFIDVKFKRIQFTPDMMPADIIGTKIFDMKSSEFYFKKGPLFTNILIADEINRTPPKTQAALLEAMEEHSITVEGDVYYLKEPYLVIATQNPVEYEGTYPLPEAQLDRFMMKLVIGYMSQEYENKLLNLFNKNEFESFDFKIKEIDNILTYEDIKKCKKEISLVEVSDKIINYITTIVRTTRNSSNVILGASPRAAIFILNSVKTFAAIKGRNYVIPEDVKEMVLPVLRHRIILKPEIEIDGITEDDFILQILNKVEVPR